MRRWFIAFLAALSLPGLIGIAAIYVRSVSANADWAWESNRRTSLSRIYLANNRRDIGGAFERFEPSTVDDVRCFADPPQIYYSFNRGDRPFFSFLDSSNSSSHFFRFFNETRTTGLIRSCGIAGFRFRHYVRPIRTRFHRGIITGPYYDSFNVTIPMWFSMAFFGAAPLAWLANRWRMRHRRKNGVCADCGYDLRASKIRCPECGRLNANPAETDGGGGWRRWSPAIAAAALVIFSVTMLVAGVEIIAHSQKTIADRLEADRAFWQALKTNDANGVRTALERGADVNVRGSEREESTLPYAIHSHKSPEIIKLLSDRGATLAGNDKP